MDVTERGALEVLIALRGIQKGDWIRLTLKPSTYSIPLVYEGAWGRVEEVPTQPGASWTATFGPRERWNYGTWVFHDHNIDGWRREK